MGRIRRAHAADVETLLTLIREYFAFEGMHFDEARVPGGLARLLGDESIGLVLLVETDEGPAGYAIATFGFDLEFGGRQATVTDVYLRERFRGRGLGRRLLAELEEGCRAGGAGALELQVYRRNVTAQALYEGHGFERADRYVMVKWLGRP